VHAWLMTQQHGFVCSSPRASLRGQFGTTIPLTVRPDLIFNEHEFLCDLMATFNLHCSIVHDAKT
jgi:hypothetical protein